MKKLLLLTLLTFNAYAVDPLIEPTTTFNCLWPDAREDGTDFPVERRGNITFYYGTSSGDYTIDVDTGLDCSLTLDNTKLNGTYYIVATSKDVGGRESLFSPEFVHVVKPVARPNPPVWVK